MTGDAISEGRGGGTASVRVVPCLHTRRNWATWNPPRRGNCLAKADKVHQDPAQHPCATMDSPPVTATVAQVRGVGPRIGATCSSARWRGASLTVVTRKRHGRGPMP